MTRARDAAAQAAATIAEGTVLQLRKAVLKKSPDYDRKSAGKKGEMIYQKLQSQSDSWSVNVEDLMLKTLRQELSHLTMG